MLQTSIDHDLERTQYRELIAALKRSFLRQDIRDEQIVDESQLEGPRVDQAAISRRYGDLDHSRGGHGRHPAFNDARADEVRYKNG